MKRSTRQAFIIASLLLTDMGTMAQKQPTYVYPETPFDEATTAKQMEEGTAIISGTAKIKKKGTTYYPGRKDPINLFPATPYIMEFAELNKKFRKGKKVATMSNDAFSYRIEGRTMDDRGTFEFKGLKPGKYYLVTWIDYQKSASYSVQTGTSVGYNYYGQAVSSWPIYTSYTYKYDVEMEVSAVVEVKADGERVTVVVTN